MKLPHFARKNFPVAGIELEEKLDITHPRHSTIVITPNE